MKLFLDKINYKELLILVDNLIARGADDVEIENYEKAAAASFGEIMPFIYESLDRERKAGIWLINFPYCVLNKNSRDHNQAERAGKGEKCSACQKCSYFEKCPGFPAGYFARHGRKEVCPMPDLPVEVMLEVEPRCNFKCAFCFNRHSFARDGRRPTELQTLDWKKIISNLARDGVKIVRFTGGEPLLRADIYDLMAWAKKKGLEVRLNTNGSLINKKNAGRIAALTDNILISVESCEPAEEDRLNGFRGALKRKKEAAMILKAAGLPVIRIGTVIRKKTIKDFDKMARLIMMLPVDEWEFYRPVPGGPASGKLTRYEIESLARAILFLRPKTRMAVSIANSIPFCFVKDRNLMNAVCAGGQFDEGRSRLVVDPRGFVKPHYFMDVNVGDPLEIIMAWNHPFMRRLRNFSPKKCGRCRFWQKCLGGSQYHAYLATDDWQSPDPWIKN